MTNQSPNLGMEIYRCSEGGTHDLVYRGKARQDYWCRKCLAIITKQALKRETD